MRTVVISDCLLGTVVISNWCVGTLVISECLFRIVVISGWFVGTPVNNDWVL